jgi:hypothetical protein
VGEQPWVTVPTAGRATLGPAVDSTGVPRDRTVVVATSADVTVPDGCHRLDDLEPTNIHRWWNAGIDYAVARGARYVLVINDDVLLGDDTVAALLGGLQATGAALATPGAAGLVTDPAKYHGRTLVGSCWLLDTASGLRPDESYRWWYGDDDLDWRARRDHGGVVSVPCTFEHLHPNHLTSTTPALLDLAVIDQHRWSAA